VAFEGHGSDFAIDRKNHRLKSVLLKLLVAT
jgi:hypothetical protein